MRQTDIADELRQAANQTARAPGPLLAQAAAEIERLRGGYRRIAALGLVARLERDEPFKIASEYL